MTTHTYAHKYGREGGRLVYQGSQCKNCRDHQHFDAVHQHVENTQTTLRGKKK